MPGKSGVSVHVHAMLCSCVLVCPRAVGALCLQPCTRVYTWGKHPPEPSAPLSR